MIINHNMASLNTYRQMSTNMASTAKSLEKLSSGLRINKAGDDAAGLAISEKMRGQIRGLDQSQRNAQDGISMIQTAEGSLSETHSILQRMKELATQSANDTNVGSDRTEIQKEINQLTSEINRIGNTTEFNTQKLLNGGTGKTGQVLYSVATAGVAGTAGATGAVSTISTVTGSIKGGTAVLSGVITNAAGVIGVAGSTAAVAGTVSPLFTTTVSGKAGAGETQLFRAEVASVKAGTSGTVGSPTFTTETVSNTGGTGAATAITEIKVGGTATVVNGGAVPAVNATTAGVNTYQITANFGEGQTFTVAGQTFTAKQSGAVAAKGEFNIDTAAGAAGITGSVANLKAAMQANATISSTYTVTDNGTDTITLTETNIADGNATNAGVATLGAGTKAEYGFEVKSQFTAGDQITVGGQTFKAVAGAAGAGEFQVGASIAATTTALKTALAANATLAANYDFSQIDSEWGADGSVIVMTQKVAGADATKATVNVNPAVVKSASEQGVYKFEIATNFADGQKITIGGRDFTAGTGANSATNFQIGADVQTTATNLIAAINLAKSDVAGSPGLQNYTVSQHTGTGIYQDTIKFTEVAATGVALGAPSVTNQAEVAGKYAFEVKTNYTVGDKIEIGGQTLTGHAGVSDATHFQIGADQAATATGIAAAITANGTLNTRFTAAAGAGSFGNNKVTLTEIGGQATGVAIAAPTTTKVAQINGSYDFSVVKNFAAGEKITIDGQDFTAKASGAVAANGEFNVGADTDTTTASLKTALTAKIGTHFTVGGAGSNVTLVENATKATAAAPIISATTGAVTGAITEVRGDYSFKLTTNTAVGDKLTIGGKELVGVSGVAAAGQFKVGATIKDTTDNLITAINADTTIGIGQRFTASKTTDVTDPLNPVYSVKLLEDTAKVVVAAPTATASKVIEQRGAYTFNVNTNFAAKDKIEIGGQTFTAKASGAVAANGEFNIGVGADATTTAASLRDAINANAILNVRYAATASGSGVALTEKANQATGVVVIDPTVKGDATAGQYKFATNAMVAGSKLTIDDVDLTIAAGGTEVQTAAEIKTLVDANSTLSAKYTVAVSGADVTLTQKDSKESSTAPKLAYTTQAGSGFLTQMQIGANTGQSMTLDIKDMRSKALALTSETGTAGQTVTADGKEYAVKWTATQSVTNGTDNVSQEFALDVSTHDNATAAVKVIGSAIERVSAERSKLGAYTNRLEHTSTNLGTSSENLTAAESRVRDVDMAKEMMAFQKNNILTQAAQAMMAQANQQPQGILQLLR